MYAHIEDGKITQRGNLPQNWRNISGLHHSEGDDEFLSTIGWLPVVEAPAELGENEILDGEEIVIGEFDVRVTQRKRAMTAREIEGRAVAAAQAEIDRLEGSVSPRRLREALLTNPGRSVLQGIEDAIAAERVKLAVRRGGRRPYRKEGA